MNDKTKAITWKDAIMGTPGPITPKDYLVLFIKGICMGSADIIPGVSGGTIALITGIYHKLLDAIQSFGGHTIGLFLKFKIKDGLHTMHLRFLFTLLFGIALAMISIARVMNYLLKNHPEPTWSLFFGLIAASILIIGSTIKNWKGTGGIGFICGALFGFFLVGMIPVSTPETWWFILLCGAVAICAMILPGISGAFILLILGKYEFITSALKQPFDGGNLAIIGVFIAGCMAGLMGFSRVLSYLLKHYENATMAVLTGLMLGSMRKIWPWKEVLETKMIRDKIHVLREANVLPDQIDGTVLLCCGLMIVGFLLIFGMHKVAQRHEQK